MSTDPAHQVAKLLQRWRRRAVGLRELLLTDASTKLSRAAAVRLLDDVIEDIDQEGQLTVKFKWRPPSERKENTIA